MDLLEYLEEDRGFMDLTSQILPSIRVRAQIISHGSGILAGIQELKWIFEYHGVKFDPKARDGERINPDQVIAELEGDSRVILELERLALNILGRMSGIASLTREFITKASRVNPKIRIAATRKTTPGFRRYEKKAVMIGGGDPHRFDLGDEILIKDNHLKLISIPEAISRARKISAFKKVEVEVESIQDAILAAESGADIIMLDNMSPDEIREVVRELESRGLRSKLILEASGGIHLGNIQEYAATGVDVISVGAITHSSPWLDFSLEFLVQSSSGIPSPKEEMNSHEPS